MSGRGNASSPGSGRARTSPISRQINGKRQFTAFNATRHLRPICGAKAKSTGEPCRNMPMKNGRCYRHGGRTPKGKAWGLPVWPDRDAPGAMDKVDRKLRDLQKAAKRREKRVAAMTPEERAAYDAWKWAHKPGTPADRARARAERKRNAEARAMIARMQAAPSPPSDAAAGLAEAQEFLRRQSEAITRREAASRSTADVTLDQPYEGDFS